MYGILTQYSLYMCQETMIILSSLMIGDKGH